MLQAFEVQDMFETAKYFFINEVQGMCDEL